MHTHAHTGGPSALLPQGAIQDGHHMGTLGDGALQTRIVGITGEQSDKLRLALITGIIGVEVAKGLEAGNAAYWFCGTGSVRCKP